MARAAGFDVLAMLDMVDGKSGFVCPIARHPISTLKGCKVALMILEGVPRSLTSDW